MRNSLLLAGVLSLLLITAPSYPSADKEEKQMLQQLQNEVTVLQRQIRDLQESNAKYNGQVTTLITQMLDNVSSTASAVGQIKEIIQKSQGDFTAGINASNGQIAQVNEKLIATNNRLERLSEKLIQLQHSIDEKVTPRLEPNPSNPEQLFAAAYSDYARGNYDLAISEFKLYLEIYNQSEAADNAQFWIGEALLSQGKLPEAIAEFDKVITNYPKGDRAPAARLKKALALLQAQLKDEAVSEFRSLIKLHPNSAEAEQARQKLTELGVPIEEPRRRR